MAWRVLRKQRLYSILDISGLAVGLATAMLLLLWISSEPGYDRFHTQHERIVKVMSVYFPRELDGWVLLERRLFTHHQRFCRTG